MELSGVAVLLVMACLLYRKKSNAAPLLNLTRAPGTADGSRYGLYVWAIVVVALIIWHSVYSQNSLLVLVLKLFMVPVLFVAFARLSRVPARCKTRRERLQYSLLYGVLVNISIVIMLWQPKSELHSAVSGIIMLTPIIAWLEYSSLNTRSPAPESNAPDGSTHNDRASPRSMESDR